MPTKPTIPTTASGRETKIPPAMSAADFIQMMRGYSDVQKTYTQYAVGSLVLPLTFLRELLGIPKDTPIEPYINYFLWVGWIGLLTCVGTSLAYQTVAARRIAEYLGGAPFQKTYPRLWFGLATGSFFVGLLCLFIGVVQAKVPPKEQTKSSQAAAASAPAR